MNSIKETVDTKALLVRMSELERKLKKMEKKAKPPAQLPRQWGPETHSFLPT
jgi:hypothetical protein